MGGGGAARGGRPRSAYDLLLLSRLAIAH